MKTIISKLNPLALAVVGAAALFAGPSMAFDVTGKGFVQYGDGQSYSLPVLQLQDGCTGPGCAYYVNSTPGAIKGLTVLGTGSDGEEVVTNFSGMDNAYATPSGKKGKAFWRPDADTYQGTTGAVVNNGVNTWDTSLAALKSYLKTGDDIEQMIFFFNNNQVKSLGTYGESLAAWAQITVKKPTFDLDGKVNGFTVAGVYDFTNRGTTAGSGGAYRTVGEGGGGVLNGNVANYTSTGAGPVTGNRASTDYVLSGGQLCLSGINLVDCNNPATPITAGPIDHNLGANEAAYAVMFPELNRLLFDSINGTGLFVDVSDEDLALYTMSVDIRLGCDPATLGGDTGPICLAQTEELYGYGRNLNNGYEQIFISKASDVVNVPEPGTLLLTGLALVGLAGLRRRAA